MKNGRWKIMAAGLRRCLFLVFLWELQKERYAGRVSLLFETGVQTQATRQIPVIRSYKNISYMKQHRKNTDEIIIS